jgi:hypothetical protein
MAFRFERHVPTSSSHHRFGYVRAAVYGLALLTQARGTTDPLLDMGAARPGDDGEVGEESCPEPAASDARHILVENDADEESFACAPADNELQVGGREHGCGQGNGSAGGEAHRSSPTEAGQGEEGSERRMTGAGAASFTPSSDPSHRRLDSCPGGQGREFRSTAGTEGDSCSAQEGGGFGVKLEHDARASIRSCSQEDDTAASSKSEDGESCFGVSSSVDDQSDQAARPESVCRHEEEELACLPDSAAGPAQQKTLPSPWAGLFEGVPLEQHNCMGEESVHSVASENSQDSIKDCLLGRSPRAHLHRCYIMWSVSLTSIGEACAACFMIVVD